jgi:hypothetical protein
MRFLAILFLVCPLMAHGITLVEPDVSAENDLAECTVTATDAIGRVATFVIPASSPAGLGRHENVEATMTGVEGDSTLFGTCADLFGGISEQSNTVSHTFPSSPPAAPTLSP